jgi:hypothetical protein
MAACWGFDTGLVLCARLWLGGIGVLSANALVDECEGGRLAANFVDVRSQIPPGGFTDWWREIRSFVDRF